MEFFFFLLIIIGGISFFFVHIANENNKLIEKKRSCEDRLNEDEIEYREPKLWSKKEEAEALKQEFTEQERNMFTQLLANESDDIKKSVERNEISLGMHINLVDMLFGERYQQKRDISKDKSILICSYLQDGTNTSGNPKYKLQVKFENDRVISYKDL